MEGVAVVVASRSWCYYRKEPEILEEVSKLALLSFFLAFFFFLVYKLQRCELAVLQIAAPLAAASRACSATSL